MIKLTIKWGSTPFVVMDELIKTNDKNGNFFSIEQLMVRKFSKYNVSNKTKITELLNKHIFNSDKVYIGSLAIEPRITQRDWDDKITNKFPTLKSVDYKDRQTIKNMGNCLIFENNERFLIINFLNILGVKSDSTVIIFDIYNADFIPKNKIDPESFGFKRIKYNFVISNDFNTNTDLATSKAYELSKLSDDISWKSKHKFEGLKELIQLDEWMAWTTVLETFVEKDMNMPLFLLNDNKTFSIGDKVVCYSINDDNYKKLKKNSKNEGELSGFLQTQFGNDSTEKNFLTIEDEKIGMNYVKNVYLENLISEINLQNAQINRAKFEIDNQKKLITELKSKSEEHYKKWVENKCEYRITELLLNTQENENQILAIKKDESQLINEINEARKQLTKIKENKKDKNYINNYQKIEHQIKQNELLKDELQKRISEINKVQLSIKLEMENIKNLKQSIENFKHQIQKAENETSRLDRQLTINKDNLSALMDDKRKIDTKLELISNYIGNKQLVKFYFTFHSNLTDDQLSLTEIDCENGENNTFSMRDLGSLMLARRTAVTKKRLLKGSYKNPFILHSILNVMQSTSNIYAEDSIIDKEGWMFGDSQKKAINKMIQNQSSFFLQGPPGTGKTTTISRVAEMIAQKGEQVLMSSTTKAAITGFIDRIENMSSSNPNIFAVLNIQNETDDEMKKYLFDSLYDRHINKMINFINNDTKLDDDVDQEILENINTNKFWSLEIKNIESSEGLDNDYWSFLVKKIKEVFGMRMIIKHKLDAPYYELTLRKKKEIADEIKSDEQSNISPSDDKKIQRWIDSGLIKYDTNEYVNVKKETTTQTQSSLKQLVKNHISNITINPQHNQLWNNFIIENGLTNVIAQTNTSRLSLESNVSSKDIIIDFDIDTVIIDEVSKTTSLDALRMATNAKRVVFAGDYRQLPPDNDFDKKKIGDIFKVYEKSKGENYVKNEVLDEIEEDIKTFQLDWTTEEIKNTLIDKWEKKVKSLYKDSMFKKLILQSIRMNLNSNYEILKEARRFNDDILEVVNTFYPKREGLSSYNQSGKSGSQIKFKCFNEERGRRNVYAIDTSYVNYDNYNTSGKQYLKQDLENSTYTIQQDGTSLTNEFHVKIIGEILDSLIKNGEKPTDIGVISLNRGQSNILKNSYSTKYAGIVFETINWFQGREKKIIIVDYVWAKWKFRSADKSFEQVKNKKLDFFSFERLNVAVSRAQNLLINVGAFENHLEKLSGDFVDDNGNTFSTDPFVQRMMNNLRRIGTIIKEEL